MSELSPFERDLYLRAERLCTVERYRIEKNGGKLPFPTDHIESIYQEIRLEISNGATVEQAHDNVRIAIAKRTAPKDEV